MECLYPAIFRSNMCLQQDSAKVNGNITNPSLWISIWITMICITKCHITENKFCLLWTWFFFPLQEVRLYNGLYSIYIKDWLQVFPHEQVLVVRMEDYQKNISKALEDIYCHLGLSEFSICFAKHPHEGLIPPPPILILHWLGGGRVKEGKASY